MESWMYYRIYILLMFFFIYESITKKIPGGKESIFITVIYKLMIFIKLT
jgi:hypothetical protein